MKGLYLAVCLMAMSFAGTASAQNIVQSRGVDQTVDYASLTRYGPWDDRNYEIVKPELDLLADNEAELTDPIPAFFRIELRREFPHLRRAVEFLDALEESGT